MPKRKKDDDDDEDEEPAVTKRGGIANMANLLINTTQADAKVLVDIMNYNFDTTEWLNSMDIQKLEKLNLDVAKFKSRETIDTAVRSYAQQNALMVSVEDYFILIK